MHDQNDRGMVGNDVISNFNERLCCHDNSSLKHLKPACPETYKIRPGIAARSPAAVINVTLTTYSLCNYTVSSSELHEVGPVSRSEREV